MNDVFDHEKLDVYNVAIDFCLLIEEVVKRLPKERTYLVDQLLRAGSSIPLNIAEGAGEYSDLEKGRFYRMAKRSATECASIFDIFRRLRLVEEEKVVRGRQLLLRIVSMLTKMVRNIVVNVPAKKS